MFMRRTNRVMRKKRIWVRNNGRKERKRFGLENMFCGTRATKGYLRYKRYSGRLQRYQGYAGYDSKWGYEELRRIRRYTTYERYDSTDGYTRDTTVYEDTNDHDSTKIQWPATTVLSLQWY